MKSSLTNVTLLGLLVSCNQLNQSKSLPGSRSDTTAVAGKPRTKYQVVIFQRIRESYNDDYNLMMRDFELQINQAIAQGWVPVGGVAAAGMGIPIRAMIKME